MYFLDAKNNWWEQGKCKWKEIYLLSEKKSMPATTSLLRVTESGAIMEDVSSFLTCSDLFLIPEIFPGRELEHTLLNQTEQQLIFSLWFWS